jgi:hypothetical protein
MKEELKHFLDTCSPRWRARKILQQYPQFADYLNSLYPNVLLNIQIYSFLNNQSPYCKVCSHPINSLGKVTCSVACRTIADKQIITDRLGKAAETLRQKYGVSNICAIEGAQAKRQRTMMSKYGSRVSDLTRQKARERSNDLQLKGRKTIKEKYGIDNVSQLPSVKEKKKQSMIKKYGVDNPSQIHLSDLAFQTLTNKNLLEDFLKDRSMIEASTELNVNLTSLYRRCNEFGIGNFAQNSSYEAEIDQWLKTFPVKYVRNTRSIIKPLELDFYFPDHNLAIEFNGLSHHSEFLGKHIRNNNIDFKTYHYKKWKECDERGITLISIFEDEWNNKKEIIKHKIMRMLGLNSCKSIGARQIQVVDPADKSAIIALLDKHHWQGSIKNFQVGIEARYHDQLIGAMTFSKNKDKTYILSRYCISQLLHD